MTDGNVVNGTVEAGFDSVREEFAAAAASEGVGGLSAQLVAYHHGRPVVDLWCGPEVTGDSLLGIYSAGKGAAHLVVATLVQDGVLDLDQRVCHYWPEFAVHGKDDLSLRELMSHRSGLVGADGGFTVAQLADDHVVAQRLGAQRPYWRPGSTFGYHALVIAALTGEVVRRATGKTIGEHFTERIRVPHGVDLYFGLPEDKEHLFLSAEPPVQTPERLAAATAALTPPNSINGIAFNRNHPDNPPVWQLPNIAVVRRMGPASFGAVASARGLARMYAVAIGAVCGAAPLLTPDTAATFGQIQSTGHDMVLRQHKSFAVGFHATSEVYPVLAQGAFGHSGAGGQQAFADPRNGLAYAYSRRRTPHPAAPAPENDRIIARLVQSAQRFD
ncbi:serine hydrolase domain-containing protein [Tsukamurella soli]|uniref:Serine hydrolase domain-containing protein n=1 Tax=Tsukamurella soli TaxID=644556 RepID=A0ABP8J5H7_9ACTN